MTAEHLHPLYQAAIAADMAFDAELRRVYGRVAGDARYDYARHSATPTLARLYLAYRIAGDALHAAVLAFYKADATDLQIDRYSFTG